MDHAVVRALSATAKPALAIGLPPLLLAVLACLSSAVQAEELSRTLAGEPAVWSLAFGEGNAQAPMPDEARSSFSNRVGRVLLTEQEQYTDLHNMERQTIYDDSLLVFNTTLATYASDYAHSQVANGNCANGILTHSGGPYGENLYWSASFPPKALDISAAVAAWISEKQYYDYASNTCQTGKVCGHYTQVVWRESVKLGCGAASCPFVFSSGTTLYSGSAWLVACEYSPPGNLCDCQNAQCDPCIPQEPF
eukprot:SM000270S10368  [mRNA]  locus=s270:93874:95998:+ [translate_table: standard]